MQTPLTLPRNFLDARLLAGIALLALAIDPWIGTLDIYLAHLFFNEVTGEWLVPSEPIFIWYLFYRGPKFFLGLLAFCILAVLIGSFYRPELKRFRTPLLIGLLAMGIVPGIAAWLKHVTDVYCPIQTTLFGGKHLYTHLFEPHPIDIVRAEAGQCWPAGHASGGFALMGFMVFASRFDWRRRILFSMPGFILGWIMGLFQMVRGQHYLSHTLATIGIALIVVWALEWAIDRQNQRKTTASHQGTP